VAFKNEASTTWLALGGRRLDCANTYYSDKPNGLAIKNSGIPRDQLFILEKVGPGPFDLPLGYQDILNQFNQVLIDLQQDYVDLLLIHWPFATASAVPSSDPACIQNTTTYNATECRLNSWRAMVEIFQSGRAKAIGVSNYNQSCLQEIIDAKLPLPSYNMCPFHLYRSSTQQALIDFCKNHNILFGGYSPFGALDNHTYPGPTMSPQVIQDPRVIQVAKAHNVTPSQVLLQWYYALGVPTQPRSQNMERMKQNLNSYYFKLTQEEIDLLNSAPQDYCSEDPKWYACAPDP